MRMISVLLAVTCAVSAAFAQGAAPKPATKRDPVADAANRAKAAFEAGRFEEAALAYQEAYRLEPVTTLLYNIAFLYDAHLNDRTLALDYYRRYVNAPDAAPASRLKAYERIALLDKQLRRERSAKAVEMLGAGPTPAKAPAPAVAPGVTPVVTPAAPPVAAPVSPAVKADEKGPAATAQVDTDTGVDALGVTLLSVGGATLITGAVFAILNAGTHADFEDETDRLAKADLADTGKTQALVADIGVGVGAALAVTGLVFILMDDDTAVAPTASTSGAGLTFGGRF